MDTFDLEESNTTKRKIDEISAEENITVDGDFFLRRNVDYVENQHIGKYRMVKTLGKGSSAKVVAAVDSVTGDSVAIKIIDRHAKNISDKRIYREILICSLVNHPHIAKLYDFFFTAKYFFLVFESVEGEQLYDTVLQNGPISEDRARRYFRQIISAIDYLHRNAIVHRDLKIENIMVDQHDNVKLIDFGLSNFFEKEDQLSTFCGSLYFAAPELLQGHRYVGPEVDVWSLGVILYVLLCGRVPFDDESIHALQGKIKECKFTFHRTVSEDAHGLIMRMVVPADTRITIDGICNNKWINSGYNTPINNYMLSRKIRGSLDNAIVNAIVAATSFQFANARDDLNRFAELSLKCMNSLELSYWERKPMVAMYFLAMEKMENKRVRRQTSSANTNQNIRHISISNQNGIMHNFVRLVNTPDEHGIYRAFFSGSSFKPSLEMMKTCERSSETCTTEAEKAGVQKSRIKGLLKGIKFRNASEDDTRSKITEILNKNGIVYEVNDKSYFCSYVHNDSECYFKITLYFNVLGSDHYIVMTCLNKNKELFKHVYEVMKREIGKE